MEKMTLHRGLNNPADAFICSRTTYLPGLRMPLHRHDHAEIIFIEAGLATHHVNGRKADLRAGDLLLVRPWDAHRFKALEPDGYTRSLIQFSYDVVKRLRERYYAAELNFFGGGEPVPQQFSLSGLQKEWLQKTIDQLAQAPRSVLEIERFLINLHHELAHPYTTPELAVAPAWLLSACRQINEPRHFQRGLPALAALAGRRPEYVTRLLKKYLGKTATEMINEARMNYAAGQLLMTSKKVGQIVRECGFAGRVRFNQLFRLRYGITPLKYRRRPLGS